MIRTLDDSPLPVHKAKKKIPHWDGQQTVYPTEENGYKYEMLATDLVEYMGSCLPFEVRREAEFAPVKNKTGVDSVESAREMLVAAGITL
jgi:UDP-N-acetylglucosamine/UDP-N-acetylgalactosamine diphosphorylase